MYPKHCYTTFTQAFLLLYSIYIITDFKGLRRQI